MRREDQRNDLQRDYNGQREMPVESETHFPKSLRKAIWRYTTGRAMQCTHKLL
jgi:hypothetical protein